VFSYYEAKAPNLILSAWKRLASYLHRWRWCAGVASRRQPTAVPRSLLRGNSWSRKASRKNAETTSALTWSRA